MANHGDKRTSGAADADLSESSVYGDGQTELDGDDVATTDRIDRLESIIGGDGEEPLVLKGKLRRQFDARDGSGRVDDDVAEEQLAGFTEVGPMADDRGGESVAPGRDDTSAVLRRHRPRSEAVNDSDAILEGNIDPPLDEELDEDDPEHR